MALTWAELAARLRINPMNVAYVFGALAVALAVSTYCWRRGDRTDRLVAATFGACWMGSLIAMWLSAVLLNDVRPPMFWRLIWEAVTASVFLYAAVRRQAAWYGLAAMAQGAQMAGRALDVALHEPAGPLFYSLIVASDLMNVVMMVAMIGAVSSPRASGAGPALR